jgi:hypothetical protein
MADVSFNSLISNYNLEGVGSKSSFGPDNLKRLDARIKSARGGNSTGNGGPTFDDVLRNEAPQGEVLRNSVPQAPEKNSPPRGAAAGAVRSTKLPVIDRSSKLYEQCAELETFLVKNLLKGMRATIQKSSLIDQGFAGEMYEDMLYDEYAKSYSKNAGFGLADLAYLELQGLRK